MRKLDEVARHLLDQRMLLVFLVFIAILSGCSTLVVQDPTTKTMSLGERFARFQEKRLSYFQQTAFDSRGNTLTRQDLKELFEKEGDKEALRELNFNPKFFAVTNNLYWGAVAAFLAYKINEWGGQEDNVQMAQFPWVMASGFMLTTAAFNLFSKNLTSELKAIDIYNRNLTKRLVIPIHAIEPAIY